MEEWRDIEGYGGAYQISNLGRVKTFKKHGPKTDGFKKPQLTYKGYHKLALRDGVSRKHFFVHQLVARAFIPNPENKPMINHKNGIKTDNRAENLEWSTNSENQIHAYRNGLNRTPHGEDAYQAVINEGIVREIMRLRHEGATSSQIAKGLNVSRSIVGSVISGRSWNHVTQLPRRHRHKAKAEAVGIALQAP